jgi:hypothetical protein
MLKLQIVLLIVALMNEEKDSENNKVWSNYCNIGLCRTPHYDEAIVFEEGTIP